MLFRSEISRMDVSMELVSLHMLMGHLTKGNLLITRLKGMGSSKEKPINTKVVGNRAKCMELEKANGIMIITKQSQNTSESTKMG